MSRKSTFRTLSQMSDINMTPLMDLTFLLLITFIITFPLIEQGIRVNLPRGAATELPQSETHTITLDLEGRIYLDKAAMTRESLAEQMQQLGRTAPESVVLVRADEGISYGQLVKVLKVLHDAKISRMALVTRAEGDGDS